MAKTPTPTEPLSRRLPYTQGTGSPGPGPNRSGPIDFTQTGIQAPHKFQTFGCKVFNAEDPLTPDWEVASQYFVRKVFNEGSLSIPEMGVNLPFWGFEDTLKQKGKRLYPSPMIRMQAGQVAHVHMQTRFGQHTIHHHGLEPTTMNDGVGHVSFETSDEYIYQFKPRHPGTFFYHCHVNTVLHFKMGLYGLLIIDPAIDGWGSCYDGATKHRYDVEQFWVLDAMDPRWHALDRQAGLCGEDAGLNVFQPEYFFVNGVHKTRTASDSGSGSKPPVAVKAQLGQRVLIRILNGDYGIARIKIDGVPSECVAMDGHSINGSAERPWAKPYAFRAGEAILLPTASRMDLWIDTAQIPGVTRGRRYTVDFEYLDWVTKQPHNLGTSDPRKVGTAQTYIEIL